MFLAKMLNSDQVGWNGPDIVVFNDVIIHPPYKPENVEVNPGGKTQQLEYVKKLVLSRQEQNNNNNNNNNINSNTSSSSSATSAKN